VLHVHDVTHASTSYLSNHAKPSAEEGMNGHRYPNEAGMTIPLPRCSVLSGSPGGGSLEGTAHILTKRLANTAPISGPHLVAGSTTGPALGTLMR
jgi:hypothetical protein